MKKMIGFMLAIALLAACGKVDEGSSQSSGGPSSAPPGSAGSTKVEHNASTIPHTLRIGDIQDIPTLNPHLASALSLGLMSQLTMAYLVRYGPHNEAIPELVTQVPTKQNHLVSADGLTITWKLRHGVKWSDGAPFNADDVVFSTNVVNNPKNNEIGRDGWDLITKIDEPDKYTVVYHLKRPYAAFLPLYFGTAGAEPCLLPKHLLGSLPDINHAPYNTKPVGIGPFRYVAWVRGDHVEMEANPYYWRGTPKLKKIIYKIIPDRNTLLTQINTGEVDMWPLVTPTYYERVKSIANVTTISQPGFLYEHLDFNLSRPLLADKPLRQALRYALDRPAILAKLLHGLGVLAEEPTSPIAPLYVPLPRIPFDLTKANALLDADGWKRGTDGVRVKNGKRLVLDFASQSGQPDADQIIEFIRSTWKQIGASINALHYPPTIFFGAFQDGGTIYAGKFDLILFSWQLGPDGDLSNIFECSLIPPNGQNDMRWCNAHADALMDQMKVEYEVARRKELLAGIQREIIADAPTIVMWIREDIYTYNSDLIGWHPNATTPFDDMMNVDI